MAGAEEVTVNTAEDLMEEVFAVMVNAPVAASGMVIEVLKVPAAAVLRKTWWSLLSRFPWWKP
jgi:hypothetical protein